MDRSPDSSVTAIILAAGRGERFGGHKLSARVQGKVILELLLSDLSDELPEIPRVVVTRPEEIQLQMVAQKFGAQTVLIDSSAMGYSLAAGVSATDKSAGWLILLGDQPLIDPALIRRLIATWRTGSRVVAASLSGRMMPPALFDRSYREKLVALHEDEGAQRILRQDGVPVPWPKGDWCLDLDTPQDLKALSARVKKRSPAETS